MDWQSLATQSSDNKFDPLLHTETKFLEICIRQLTVRSNANFCRPYGWKMRFLEARQIYGQRYPRDDRLNDKTTQRKTGTQVLE